MGAIPRHRDGIGPPQHPRLGPDQGHGQDGGKGHDPHGQAFRADRLGRDQMPDRFLAHQGGGGEDQSRLQEAGKGFRLAMAVAVLAVRRRRRVAHRQESRDRGRDVQP